MMKRTIFVGMIVVLRICLPAQGQPWLGSGTEAEPYLIADANDMQAIGADPNYWGAHFKLTNDINLAKYTGTEFNIIGYYIERPPQTPIEVPFTGVFDGSGHIISKFTYTSIDTDRIGLFCLVDDPNAIIKDVGLINPNIDAGADSSYVGSLIGSLFRGTVSGCYADGGSVSGDSDVGGLIGSSVGTILNCHATGTVNGNYTAGGLIGFKYGAILLNSYSGGTVSGNDHTGGLVGLSMGEGIIAGCHSTADVYGYSATGGLLGALNLFPSIVGQGLVSNCYARGNVEGFSSVGGLVGTHAGDRTISYCYSVGPVDGSINVGGLTGSTYNGAYDSCFWDSEVNPDVNGIGDNSDPNVIEKSTENMQRESTFTDWDFVEIWGIGENQTYPYLRVYPAGDLNHDGRVNLPDFAIFSERWMAGIE